MSSAADLVFVNGDVYTVDAARSWARAVAVRDGAIVAVGTDDEIRDLIGDGTDVVDLAGRMLVPGFQDAHVHPVGGGVDMLQCDQHDLDTKEAYLESIATYARTHPDQPWILGGGWSQDVFPRGCPAKEDIDAIVSDRPVILPNRDGHSAWVNSKALEIAGITADTPDPEDGRIERNPDGSPQGTLHEGAQTLVAQHQPPLSPDTVYEGLLKGQAFLHALGITGWQDAIVDDSDAQRELPGVPRRGGPRHAHRPRGRRPVVGALARSRADRRPGGAARRWHRGTLRRHKRQDHAGRCLRELHRRDDRSLSRRARPCRRTTTGSRWSSRSC